MRERNDQTALYTLQTRVLVTHGVHWLPMVDMIAVVTDGEISEYGSYDELMSHNGAFAELLSSYLEEKVTHDKDESDDDSKSFYLFQKMKNVYWFT